MGKRKAKQRGVPVEVGGEAGLAMRNAKFPNLIDAWEGATTISALFERSCKKYSGEGLLGKRVVIARDFVTGSDGRKFEKLHLGEYQWETYAQVYDRVSNFASGLVKVGHDLDTRIAIFADSCPEWFISFQVVRIYSFF